MDRLTYTSRFWRWISFTYDVNSIEALNECRVFHYTIHQTRVGWAIKLPNNKSHGLYEARWTLAQCISMTYQKALTSRRSTDRWKTTLHLPTHQPLLHIDTGQGATTHSANRSYRTDDRGVVRITSTILSNTCALALMWSPTTGMPFAKIQTVPDFALHCYAKQIELV